MRKSFRTGRSFFRRRVVVIAFIFQPGEAARGREKPRHAGRPRDEQGSHGNGAAERGRCKSKVL